MERRIVVSGYYGSKNAGDEAMLAAMLEVLGDLDPKLHITVISASPADTSERHGVESISWLGFPSIIKALWHADLLISGAFQLRDTDLVLSAVAQALPVNVVYRTRYWVTLQPQPV